jgi:uncharacterized GH25 family protein
VSGASGDALLTLVAASNVITMQAGEFHEYLSEEGLTSALETRKRRGESDAPARERYTKFAKTIVRAGQGDGGFARAAGLPLEFVPERDPFTTGHGEALSVRLLFNGAPAADVQVIVASTSDPKPRAVGRTDAAGRIHVPLDAGRWRLHAVLMERSAEPAIADWESYWATLTFEVR